MSSWNWLITEIILCDTSKRARTVQRRVRSTESYVLVSSIQHTTEFFSSAPTSVADESQISYRWQNGSVGNDSVPPEDPHAFAVLAETARDDLQQYLAGVCYQRDAPVVVLLCPILLFMEYRDDGIFPLLRHLAPAPNTNDDIEQSPALGAIKLLGPLSSTMMYDEDDLPLSGFALKVGVGVSR